MHSKALTDIKARIWRFSTGDAMMTATDRVQAIFQDDRELQADALEMLTMGKVRNAAEKD